LIELVARGQAPVTIAVVAPEETRVLWAGPNPFVLETAVSFVLPRSGTAAVVVHTVAGRRVAVLADGPLAAGQHGVRWDGRDSGGARSAPGVYFVRLDLDGTPLGTERVVLSR
jgi:hypothetical protein